MELGATTENSMGEEVSCYCPLLGLFSAELPEEELLSLCVIPVCGRQITALSFAKLNSRVISLVPQFLKGSLNF